jgi:hypothetical protein
MTRPKKCGLALAGFLALCGLQAGEQLGVPGMKGFISSAEAVVGRPLTPVSVAGVARRTTRRCAAGVTYC